MNLAILDQFTYGMYAVGVKGEKGPSACICTSAAQVSPAPGLPDCRVHQPGKLFPPMHRTKRAFLCVGTVPQYQRRRDRGLGLYQRTLPGASSITSATGYCGKACPVIKEDTCCWVLCEVVAKVDAGTHTIFIGKVLAGSESFVGQPMSYDYYRTVIKGAPARNAPLYRPLPSNRSADGESFICPVCGYRFSDPDIPFEELPEHCPSCGAPRHAFVRG